MEVVVIGDGGDAEAGGVVLGCGVGPIVVAGILRDAGVTVLRQLNWLHGHLADQTLWSFEASPAVQTFL